MRVRDYLVRTAVEVFRLYGYEPLDSPVMELWETLSAKGGAEIEAETFKFLDKGEREVGLRFDLTVPLARIVASNPHLPKPFKRYAVGKAWRYDRPQAGRYREFMQADVDVIGSASPAADAEVVLVALEFARRTIEDNYVMKINNRKVLKGLTERAGVKDSLAHECFRAIDKLDKVGRDGVVDELRTRGIGEEESEFLLNAIKLRGTGLNTLDEFRGLLEGSEIGTFVAFARRSGEDWYVAVLNCQEKQKTYSIPLAFLGEGNYEAALYHDALGPHTSVKIEAGHSVQKEQTISVRLKSGGGFVGRFSKSKEYTK